MKINTYYYKSYCEFEFGKVEERSLTIKELHTLYIMCKIARKNNINLIFGFVPEANSYCIHKSPENEWIVSFAGEKGSGNICGIFNDVFRACIKLINLCVNESNKTKLINELNYGLNSEINDDELNAFACVYNYVYKQDRMFLKK